MEDISKLLRSNKNWARDQINRNRDYFKEMSEGQQPTYLWIGCADSRVPPSEITNTAPGEMFVHRNIANLVLHTDLNFQSVLAYAVEHLKVDHIIVCGHYNCGGVQAAFSHDSLGIINSWVRNIKDTYSDNEVELDLIPSQTDKENRLVELSVIEQVKNLCHTLTIQKAWKESHAPYVHGMVYDLNTGLLKQLTTIEPGHKIESVYRYELNQ